MVKQGYMKLSIVGMSGSGKSYWSKKLQEEKGFNRFCCDDIIEQKLSRELKKLGYSGLQDIAKWMGQPFDPQYKKRSRKYLYFEKEAMDEILKAVEYHNLYNRDIVVDTTGSIIYAGDGILHKLSKLTRVVYLNTPTSIQQEMYRLYLEDPKPVIWGKSFYKVNGESNIEALRKCYPRLLTFRSARYEKIANIILNHYRLRNSDFSISKFMEVIKQ